MKTLLLRSISFWALRDAKGNLAHPNDLTFRCESLGLTASVSTGGPEARDHNGCTALMFAVANGNEARGGARPCPPGGSPG